MTSPKQAVVTLDEIGALFALEEMTALLCQGHNGYDEALVAALEHVSPRVAAAVCRLPDTVDGQRLRDVGHALLVATRALLDGWRLTLVAHLELTLAARSGQSTTQH